jgi:riboflavin kinase/FMN adenylyltransferase
MQSPRILTNGSAKPSRPIVAIGNFDGLHLGHQKLLATAIEIARAKAQASAALLFDPPPKCFFGSPHDLPPPIFSIQQKVRALREFGVDQVVIQPFDQDFANLSPASFVQDFVVKILAADSVVVGENFRFGKQRSGDGLSLQALGEANHLSTTLVPLLQLTNRIAEPESIVSSSQVRQAIVSGNMELAVRMLGRPYTLEGTTVAGSQLGRKLGFPTLNFACEDSLVPGHGVYWGYCATSHHASRNSHHQAAGESPFPLLSLDQTRAACVVSIGTRPTFSGAAELRIEAHLIEGKAPSMNYYGHRGILYLVEKIRDQSRFPDERSLKEAIAKDIALAKNRLKIS